MYGIYGDIIGAAERALESFDEYGRLLEYPEVQADKAYYLSVLSKYNALAALKDKLDGLKSALCDERDFSAMLQGETNESAREGIYEEISLLRRRAGALSREIASALGCTNVVQCAIGRFKFSQASAIGAAFYSLLKGFLLSQGVGVCEEKTEHGKDGKLSGISFIAEGAGAIERLYPLAGAHKVYFQKAASGEVCFGVTEAARQAEIDESEIKVEVFRSHGAGGQNINKVETAVRAVHLPTGITVVCQDERSQLTNRRRAIETLKKRLLEQSASSEKKRIEADICAQHRAKNTPLSFDGEQSTMTDTRLAAFNKIAFPLTDGQFLQYMTGLSAI